MLALSFSLNIGLGSVEIPWEKTWQILLHGSFDQGMNQAVIWQIRLPRALAALFCGAALAVAGLLLQIYFGNPMVDSFVLGTASGSSLMVGLTVMAGVGIGWGSATTPFSMITAAFLGALAVLVIVLIIGRRVRSPITLLVIGLMIGYLCSAVTSLLVAFAEKEALQGFVFWSLGSFAGFTWPQLKILMVIVSLAILGAVLLIKPLNAFLLGEDYARSMGVVVKRLRVLIVIIASVLGGAVTAFAGPVAFIGLAVPHLSRLLFGTSENRVLLPANVILGALLASSCDLLARLLLAPVELPLSAVTSCFGAPLVIALLLRRNKPDELA